MTVCKQTGQQEIRQEKITKLVIESEKNGLAPWEVTQEWLFNDLYEELCHDLFE